MPGGLAMTVDPELDGGAERTRRRIARRVGRQRRRRCRRIISLWRPTIEAAQVRRSPHDLPSRAADNLFWLGRYTERADWTMRVLRICLSRLQEDSAPRQELRASRIALEILLVARTTARFPSERSATDAQPDRAAGAQPDDLGGLVLRPAAHARQHPSRRQPDARPPVAGGLAHAQRLLREPALARGRHADRRWATRCDLLDDGLRVLAAFHGLTHENMTRNFGWSFLDMGRRLSRARNLAEVLLGIFGKARSGDDETGSLLFVLELADSFITYRSRYRLAPMLPLVLDLLLLDESNPRSVAFQLAALSRPHRYAAAVGRGRRPHRGAAHGAVAADADPARRHHRARKAEPDGTRPACRSCSSEQVDALPVLSDVIGRRYFNLIEKDAKWVRARSRAEP